jgi:phosphoserine phosphatase RsbU/P
MVAEKPESERLALLYRVSQAFNSTLDLDEVLIRVMDEVIVATRAERGFLMLRGADGHLAFRAARGIDHQTLDAPEFQVSRSVVERVAQEGRPVLTTDAQVDERFSLRQSVISMGLRSILCVPLLVRDRVSGVIYVDNRFRTGIFHPDDLELLSAIAASAAMAIENARLYAVAVEKGRMERELQMARELQAGLLPRQAPQLDGWDIACRWQPALEVAGDFYDFLTAPGGKLGWVIADVSGKGMAAALFMALARSTVRACLASAASPGEGIAHANDLICADSVSGMFVTLFYAQLDAITGDLTYVNAGHDPPLLIRPGASVGDRPGRAVASQLARTGMLMGVSEGVSYEQQSVRLEPGDLLLCYTDGVTESLDDQGREYGAERLREVALGLSGASADKVVESLEVDLAEFTGERTRLDDRTLLVVKRL